MADEHKTTEEELASRLPVWMPKDLESGNYQLLAPIAKEIDAAESDMEAVDVAVTAQHAETIEQLQEIAKLVDVTPERDESLEHYRARVIAEFQLLTSKGTPRDVLNGIATILNTEITNLGYTEEHSDAAGNVRVEVPASKMDSLVLADGELAAIGEGLLATAYRLDIFKSGTFTYLSESAYSGPYDSANGGYDPTALNSDSTLGHDGLGTDTHDQFTASTLPSGWTLNGSASYDDTNDRIDLNAGTGSTAGNAVYDAGIGGIQQWTVGEEMYIDGSADQFVVNFYADSPGTDYEPSNGYQADYNHYNGKVNLHYFSGGTKNTLASQGVTIPDTDATNGFTVRYHEGQVRIFLNGEKVLEHTISSPDYTYDGLSFAARDGGETGLHSLSVFDYLGGSPKGNGGTYATVLE